MTVDMGSEQARVTDLCWMKDTLLWDKEDADCTNSWRIMENKSEHFVIRSDMQVTH